MSGGRKLIQIPLATQNDFRYIDGYEHGQRDATAARNAAWERVLPDAIMTHMRWFTSQGMAKELINDILKQCRERLAELEKEG